MKYRAGFKYQLVEDVVIQTSIRPSVHIETDFIVLTITGLLTVKKGYAWDGASGPTWDSKSSMRASVAHDALYQLMRMRLLSVVHRPDADALFHQLCLEDGMWAWRAAIWYKSVRKFAAGAAAPGHTKPILEAP